MGIQSKEYRDRWRAENKDRIREYSKRDYEKRKEKIRVARSKPKARKKLSSYLKAWRSSNSEKVKDAMREWSENNKEWIQEYRKSYGDRRRFLYAQRKIGICARKRELSKTPKYRARIRGYSYHRRRKDIQYALKDRLRATMSRALRRQFVKKSHRTMDLIGCTPESLRAHIESLFQPGMTWVNRNLWHVDHKRPLASFDLCDVEQQKTAFNWKNLQPLWAWQNQQKSDKIPPVVTGGIEH